MSNVYYEKRIIHDMHGNVYPIWVIYNLGRFGAVRQITVAHSKEEFDNLNSDGSITFRKCTDRGME